MPNSEPHVADWLQLVRSEFIEMPELCLTKAQAQRLWGVDPVICEAVLEALADAGFLWRTRDGFYLRAGSETSSRPLVRRFSVVESRRRPFGPGGD